MVFVLFLLHSSVRNYEKSDVLRTIVWQCWTRTKTPTISASTLFQLSLPSSASFILNSFFHSSPSVSRSTSSVLTRPHPPAETPHHSHSQPLLRSSTFTLLLFLIILFPILPSILLSLQVSRSTKLYVLHALNHHTHSPQHTHNLYFGAQFLSSSSSFPSSSSVSSIRLLSVACISRPHPPRTLNKPHNLHFDAPRLHAPWPATVYTRVTKNRGLVNKRDGRARSGFPPGWVL